MTFKRLIPTTLICAMAVAFLLSAWAPTLHAQTPGQSPGNSPGQSDERRSSEALLIDQYQQLIRNMADLLETQQGRIAELEAQVAKLEAKLAKQGGSDDEGQSPGQGPIQGGIYDFVPDLRPIGGVRATRSGNGQPNNLAKRWRERGTPWLLEEFDKIVADGMERVVVWAPGGNPGGMISASQYLTMPLTDAQFDSFAQDIQAWIAAKRQTTPGLEIGVYMGNSGRDPKTLGARGVLDPFSESDREVFFATIDPFIEAGFTEFILDTGGAAPAATVEWDRLVRERTNGRSTVGGEAIPFTKDHGIRWEYIDKCAWWILDSHPKAHKALEHDFSDLDAELHWMPHAGRHPGKRYEQTTQLARSLMERGWIFDGFSPDSRSLAVAAHRLRSMQQ